MIQRPSRAKLRSLLNAVPEAHRQFIRHLEPMIEEPDIVVAHAMWETHLRNDALTIAAGLGSHAPLRHKLLWGRYSEGELAMRKQW